MKNKPRLPYELQATILEFYKSKIEENINLADAILDQYSINNRFLDKLAPLIYDSYFSSSHTQYYYLWLKNREKVEKSYNRSKSSLKYINK